MIYLYKDTWKSKIDPAFDKVVKTYLEFLIPLEKNPREGRLNLPNDCMELLPDFPDTYSTDIESPDSMFSFLEDLGIASKKDLNLFHAVLSSKNTEELLKICPALIQALPEEESRQFYARVFDFYEDHPELKPASDNFDRKTADFYSIVASLLVRYLFVRLYDEGKEVTNLKIDLFKKSAVIAPVLAVILSSFSQLANQKTLAELKANIIKGDDKSLFKAVTIDKTFLYMDEVKNRITEAQLAGDSIFFSKLGRSIASNPLKRIGQHGKTYAVLHLFWPLGLYKLTNQELYAFLKTCGLIPPAYPDAFQKFVRRHIKPIFNF